MHGKCGVSIVIELHKEILFRSNTKRKKAAATADNQFVEIQQILFIGRRFKIAFLKLNYLLLVHIAKRNFNEIENIDVQSNLRSMCFGNGTNPFGLL